MNTRKHPRTLNEAFGPYAGRLSVKPEHEPVATYTCGACGVSMQMERPWVGLTPEDILAIGRDLGLKCRLGGNKNIDFDYAQAVEVKLKEKNT